MGEYTLPMAIHLEDDLCKFVREENSMGYLFIKSINIGTCPPKPVCKYFNYYIIIILILIYLNLLLLLIILIIKNIKYIETYIYIYI